MKLLSTLLLLACLCVGQTTSTQPAPVAQVQLPTYIMAGLSYNQYTGGSGFVSGIVPESNSVGLYGSVTTDLVPVKTVNATTGKTVYLISGSARIGQHKVVFNDGKNMLLLGGDIGASFSTPGTAGVTIGTAGSFTATYVRQINAHWAVGVPVRMLYMSGVGPGGSGAWNPVLEIGAIWKP